MSRIIAANFGRLKNNPDKMRKAIAEYVELVGINEKGRPLKNSATCTNISQADIAKELGITLELFVFLSPALQMKVTSK